VPGTALLPWGVIRNPRVYILAAGSIALGLGLAAAFASVADAIFLRPLAVARPHEIVRIFTSSKLHPLGFVSYPDYEDFARGGSAFESIAAQCQVLVAVGKTGESPRVRMGLAVTTNYFDTLGVRTQLGRSFTQDDEHAPVVILSDAYWKAYWSGDPRVIGSTLQAGGVAFQVVGIAGRQFGLDRFLHEDFYVPAGAYRAGLLPVAGHPMDDRGRRYFSLYARLRRGTTRPSAQAELTALSARLAQAHAETNREHSATLLTDLEARTRLSPAMSMLGVLLVAASLLAIGIGCANAGGLILLRAESRRGEIALREALGARPIHLLMNLLAESVCVALAGIAGAVPVGAAIVRLLAQSVVWPSDLGVAMDARFDMRITIAMSAAATVCAFLCGAGPWLSLQRRDLASTRSTTASGALNVLTALQISIAMFLVTTGGGLLHALLKNARTDLGYRLDHVLTMTFDPAQVRIGSIGAREFYRELLAGVTALPGVERAALAQSIPFGMTGSQRRVEFVAGEEIVSVWSNAVTPEYFALMKMRMVEGRSLSATDRMESPRVAVINRELARRSEHPLGRSMLVDGQRVEVVGIVENAKYFDVGESPKPFLYLPFAQRPASRMALHVETRDAPESMISAVVAAARDIDARQPMSEIRSLCEAVEGGALFGMRIGVRLTMAAAAGALSLALVGLYVTVASAAERRRREMGIRGALGTGRGALLALSLRGTVGMAFAGVSFGACAACAATYWMVAAGLSVGVFTAAAAVVICATLAAGALAAWSICSMEPAVALREPVS